MSAISQTKPAFSVRLVVCDHYLTKPIPGIDVIYSEFRGSDIRQVPVFRIFGSATDGHKVCLHVHGVFPYFYVPCPNSNPAPQFLYQMATSLDKALNIAMKQAMSATQHVYKITLVKGLPFYGFHDKEHLYLKIFLYNPGLIKQAVDLCSNGAILGQPFQPHESHLNFTLQFFIDFNLFGMSNVDLQMVKFRKKTPNSQTSEDPLESPEDSFLKPESMCYYEADCMASNIINRQRIGKGDGIENPGLEEVWNQEMQRRQQLNISVASKSLTQVRLKAEETESHYKFEQIFLMKMSNLIDKPVEIKDSSEDVYYPAESLEGSQLLNATDISVHLPQNISGVSFSETLRRDMDETLTGDLDDTLVDESVVLNCSLSLHYSQVQLDSEDLDLLDVLKDMDEKTVEEDSVLGTPADEEANSEADVDDAEYSQIFNEDTILMEPFQSKDDVDESSPTWNDSFWDDANIPQLDGTFDDDHVKKVRKRKMRPFKLGLSRPKSKKKVTIPQASEESERMDDSVPDEINASRETIDSISNLHLKKSIKAEPKSLLETDESSQMSTESITELVNKVSVKYENVKLDKSVMYDKQKQFEPVAGPSNVQMKTDSNCDIKDESNDDICESSPECKENKGFISFYNASKIFDASLDDDSQEDFIEYPKSLNKIENHENSSQSTKDMKLHYSETVQTMETKSQAISPKKIVNPIILTPKFRPPTKSYIQTNLEKYNIPKVRNEQPFYSDHKDVGDKVEIGSMLIKIQSKAAHDQKPVEKALNATSIDEWRQLLFLQNNELSETSKSENLKKLLAGNRQYILVPLKRPPSYKEVSEWVNEREKLSTEEKNQSMENCEITNNIDELENSQALGLNDVNSSISLETDDKDKTATNESLQITMQPDGSFLCFGSGKPESEAKTPEAPLVEINHLTIMVLEVHASVRGDLKPDPLLDPIKALFVNITNDIQTEHQPKSTTEIVVVDDMSPPKKFDRCVVDTKITYVNNEFDIFKAVVDLVTKHDPDIICGYEIEMESWGYVLERSQVLGLELVMEISRITDKYRQKRRREDHDFEGRIIGRILFNVWRLFRHELALSSYSFENCMYEILKERVPKYSHTQLAEWWDDESRILRWVPVEFYLTRLSGTVRMLEKLDIINRTAELARLFGLQWWEVLSRGSQFRVESLMLRAARPLNLIALSPTVKQRAAMRAPECLPLIFEPESRFYADPVIVLDFQSLYPSMMIAYNYCFSTCIGRVQNISGESAYEFGAWRLRIPKAKLESLVKRGQVHWSPVGVGFVAPATRRGVLPALLRRILAARQAVKKNMKLQTDTAVKKAMHSRQLGLKLIANVTYGYTAANFSGRMPCVEVGDSVVAKGRETLERAIKLVQNNKEWNAKVVYGDTDSMFVQVPGGTRREAFHIGQQIADAVTADNPPPVALKLEKVYQPCILQTKKRYVGFMYESADQQTPVYEAKGIETVRRDGCPAGVKLLQTSLCELFTTRDVSAVRRLAVGTLSRLASGTLPPRELFFTREYRGAAAYRPPASAPPAEIAKRLTARDRRAGPRTGERVLWLVCAGAPGLPLVKLARTPAELRRDPALRPHVAYYAARVLLPPLHRCFSLLGVNVFKWWNELGYSREAQHNALTTGGGIARYLWRERCALCGTRSNKSLCASCCGKPQRAVAALCCQDNVATTHVAYCDKICASCCGHNEVIQCENMECPMQWRRITAQQKLTQVQDTIRQMPAELKCMESLSF